MRRRAFIKTIAGSLVALPLAVHAQQPAMPVIGFLGSRSAIDSALQTAAFHQALSEAGYVEGKNVSIEYHWAEGQYDRLRGMAVHLAGRQISVIVATGGPAAGYVDRILNGTRPADLPVQAPTKYELVINLKTAKALGLEVPPHLQQLADEVVE